MPQKLKHTLLGILIFLIGLAAGGLLFSRSLPRSFLAVAHCQDVCLQSKDILGLAASVGIQNLGGKLPTVVFESDKTLVFDIQYPYPEDKIHYIVAPKKDIKDIGALTDEDNGYLVDAFAVMGQIARDQHLKNYRILTNGPDKQEVTYLHFHIVADRY
jgi:histidine triad (HIT) family protein